MLIVAGIKGNAIIFCQSKQPIHTSLSNSLEFLIKLFLIQHSEDKYITPFVQKSSKKKDCRRP